MEDNGTFNSATPGTTSPIQRLPAELLSRILRQHASSIFGRQWQKHWSVLPRDWYSWILLGDVCKDWRASIYQDSYFWSHLYLPSHDILIQLGLERSKRRSICAIVDEQYLPLESLQDSISEVLETRRVEELHLRLRCDNGWFLEDPACMLTYARLKRLYLSMSMPHELHIDRIFPPDSGILPNLTELHTHRVALFWSRLTGLHMMQSLSVDYDDLGEAGITEVLRALRDMPLLQELNLAVDLYAPKPKDKTLRHSRNPLGIPIIELPHLQKFSHVCNTGYGSRLLLDYLRFPSTARIKFEFGESAPQAVTALASKLTGETTLTPTQPIEKFYISIGKSKGPFTFKGRVASTPSTGAWGKRDPKMAYTYEIKYQARLVETGEIWNMMTDTLVPLPLASVRCLALTSTFCDRTTDYIFQRSSTLGECMPNVEILRFAGTQKLTCALEELLATLIRTSQGSSTPFAFMFPRLTTIEIRNFVFARCDHMTGEHYGCLESLIQLLQVRQTHGCASIEHIRLDRCANFFKPSSIERLSQIVPRITWDRSESAIFDDTEHELFG